MITVFASVANFYHNKDMVPQMPVSEKHLRDLGHIVSTHFRREWEFVKTLNAGTIIDTGLVKEVQPGGTFVSVGYPDHYIPEMEKLIKAYCLKHHLMTEKKPEKKERKRTPLKK